jgi:hypothetical protein
MASPPRDQLAHVVVRNVGDVLVLAKEVDQQPDHMPGIVRAFVMLTHFDPVAARHIIEAQRCTRRLHLGDALLGLLPLGRFYLLRFALGGCFRRAVKAMTSPLEIEMVERRTFRAVDRHAIAPALRRRRTSSNSARSLSANI